MVKAGSGRCAPAWSSAQATGATRSSSSTSWARAMAASTGTEPSLAGLDAGERGLAHDHAASHPVLAQPPVFAPQAHPVLAVHDAVDELGGHDPLVLDGVVHRQVGEVLGPAAEALVRLDGHQPVDRLAVALADALGVYLSPRRLCLEPTCRESRLYRPGGGR